jgi:hypothetical protein
MATVRALIIARATAEPAGHRLKRPRSHRRAAPSASSIAATRASPSFFDGDPPATVGTVARASFLSPDYRAEGGRFPARFLDGSAVPPDARLEFLLALPAPDSGRGIARPTPS